MGQTGSALISPLQICSLLPVWVTFEACGASLLLIPPLSGLSSPPRRCHSHVLMNSCFLFENVISLWK